jgi:hypothetical protein
MKMSALFWIRFLREVPIEKDEQKPSNSGMAFHKEGKKVINPAIRVVGGSGKQFCQLTGSTTQWCTNHIDR